jgi:5-methyltetrahydropteroyltriglutamate--homocysteine methyltransferase
MCRGNIGHGMASGGYEPIAERMFGRLAVDGYFLEYDTPRAGDFTPLRFLPKGKKAVLGLVTTKLAEVEPVDQLRRRIEEAAKVVPIENLGLSPQCGFASAAMEDRLPEGTVERKLARIVEVARAVWE